MLSGVSACLILSCMIPTQPVAERPGIPFGGTDFKQYYTTSRLILEGQNPYDYDKAGIIQRRLGEKGDIQVPYGPPTSLLPFIPLGWFDFLTAIQIQFALNVGMLVICCFLWGQMLFPNKPNMPLISTIAVVGWIPCLSLFGMGHVTSWTLLGFTLWATMMQKEKPALAGACLALSIIKPHLAFGLVVYAMASGIRRRQWRMMVSFVHTVAFMILATWIIRPSIWQEYLGSLKQSNPTQWFNATLDGWGRYTFDQWGQEHIGAWFQFRYLSGTVGVALLGLILILAWKYAKSAVDTHQARLAALVLAIWMTATPYAFSYDFVLLLPAVILALGSWIFRSHPYALLILSGWILLDVAYVMMKGQCYELHYAYVPVTGLVLTLLLTWKDLRNDQCAEATQK